MTTRHLAHDRTSSTETDGSKNEPQESKSKTLPVGQNNPFQRTALVTIIIMIVLLSVPKCVCVCMRVCSLIPRHPHS